MLDREMLEAAMHRALELARRGPAHDANPQVGCVILDPTGQRVAEGWHRGAGTPHAEIEALAALPAHWRGRERELTAVVTLEPCNHTGRTGPCAAALAEAKIGAVAFALEDPGPIAGGGSDTLRAADVEVLGGLLASQAGELLAEWLAAQSPAELPAQSSLKQAIRPRITVKWAQSLDGRAAASDGSSQWITGSAARADVHRRRAAADAILVGTGTLLADDPALTARSDDGELLVPAAEQPLPVVLGGREIPDRAKLRDHPALAARGLDAPLRFDGSDLEAHLTELYELGVRHLFIEGGPTIASAFIASGLVDDVLIYIAPALLGGSHLALGEIGVTSMSGIKRLQITGIEQLGGDLLIQASIDHSEEGR